MTDSGKLFPCKESWNVDGAQPHVTPWSPFIITVFVIGFGLRLFFLFSVPVGGPSLPGRLSAYNDEAAHANYVLHILKTGRLPAHVESIQEQNALARAQFENYQPPLFYWGVAALCGMLGCHSVDAVTFAGRAVCILIWIGLGFVMFRIARLLALNQSAFMAIAAVWALNGTFVRYTVTLSNDALFWLWVGCAVWIAIAARTTLNSRRCLLLLGLVSIVGLYTKLTFLLLLPLALFVYDRRNKGKSVAGLAIIYGMIFLATLPVWLRNIHEFGGWLPLAAGFGSPVWQVPALDFLSFAMRSFVFPWSEFWQGFIGLLFFLPAWVFLAWSFSVEWKKHRFERQPVFAVVLGLSLLGFLWLNLRYHQAEARYLFAAWPALCVGFCRLPSLGCRWIFAAAMLLPYGLLFLPR